MPCCVMVAQLTVLARRKVRDPLPFPITYFGSLRLMSWVCLSFSVKTKAAVLMVGAALSAATENCSTCCWEITPFETSTTAVKFSWPRGVPDRTPLADRVNQLGGNFR